jgi:predicted Fe-Mo cluster-binding NifX family protein
MKILISLDNDYSLDSKLSCHFGNCAFFAIYNSNNKSLEIIKNYIDHSNLTLSPIDQILKIDVDTVFSLGMGRKAINLFKERRINLKTGNYKTLNEVIENIDNLEDLNLSCKD